MINLSVNVNKIATLRNARGGNIPNVQQVAMDIERFGADGITVHPRPDERHIRRSDVYALRPLVRTEFNIEGYPSEQFMELVLAVRPTQATLVPDAPTALTSSAGWDVEPNMEFLTGIVDRLGVDAVVFAPMDKEFFPLKQKIFLTRLKTVFAQKVSFAAKILLTGAINSATWLRSKGFVRNPV